MPNKWVAPHITGGLGNRLFELAAALGAEEKWGHQCVFFMKMFQSNDHDDASTITKLFPYIFQVTDAPSYYIYPEQNGHVFTHTHLPQTAPAERVVLGGYRQSPKYFPLGRDIMPDWNSLLEKKEKESLLKNYKLESSQEKISTWFLHVRLGDYKTLPHHQIPIVQYYSECLDKVPKGSRILLFSDEPQLCSRWIFQETHKRGLDFDICNETKDYVSMWLMSQCLGGAITANSTFSWWGAYFARQNALKPFTAFFPDVWGQGLPPAKDVIPDWGTSVHINL
jgi:hypothetical protein